MSAEKETGWVAKIINKASEILQSLFKQKEPLKTREYDVYTRIGCNKCSVIETRGFQVGDYLFKDMGSCGSCDGETMITGIYTKGKPVTPKQ